MVELDSGKFRMAEYERNLKVLDVWVRICRFCIGRFTKRKATVEKLATITSALDHE